MERDVIGGKDLAIGITRLKHYPLKLEDRYIHTHTHDKL